MTREQIVELLQRLGMTRDGDAFAPPAGLGVTVYIGGDREPLVVDHVTRIETSGNLVVVTAQRRERVEKFGAGVDSVRTIHVFTAK